MKTGVMGVLNLFIGRAPKKEEKRRSRRSNEFVPFCDGLLKYKRLRMSGFTQLGVLWADE